MRSVRCPVKVLFTDIETAPHLVMAWGLFDQNISIDKIIKPGYTLCYASKWLGSRDVNFDSIQKSGEKRMLRGIHSLMDEADAIVTYNGVSFDIPTLNREFIKANMLPPAPYRQVDLYQEVKKHFRFASNKLDWVARELGLGGKVQHKGMDLWKECMSGNRKSWKEMEKYNRYDVVLLEKVYHKVLPWIKSHPNWGLYGDSPAPRCPNCGGMHLQRRGIAVTLAKKYPRYQCVDCGGWSRGSPVNAPRRPL